MAKTSKRWEESRQSSRMVEGGTVQNSRVEGSSRIRFKASGTTDEVMREAVRKDRENIEKLFKETRMNYLKPTS